MPVLSEQPHRGLANLPTTTLTYVFLGAVVLALLGVYISRKTKSTYSGMSTTTTTPEKEPLIASLESQSASLAKPRIPRPPQPPPFTPPMLEQTEMNFSSFEPFEPVMELPPRRRSYTRTMSDGTEVSGEIIVAEGWRRHTRVFGGGVCKACEESERRMSA